MSYHLTQIGGEWKIDASMVAAAFEALKRAIRGAATDDSIEEYLRREYAAHDALDADTFGDAMADFDWELSYDDDGNVVDMEWIGDAARDETFPLWAIGPYSREGSFVDFRGEEGEHGRYVVEHGETLGYSGHVIYGNDRKFDLTDHVSVEIQARCEITVLVDDQPVSLVVVPSLTNGDGSDGYWCHAFGAALFAPLNDGEFLVGSWRNNEDGEFVRLFRDALDSSKWRKP